MFVHDLISVLKTYPELSSVFIVVDGVITDLGDTGEIWVRSTSPDGYRGPYVEVSEDATDYGVLLI